MSAETFIHPSAVVEPGARLGAGVHVGPFCHVGPDVELGDGVRLASHVSVVGVTAIGNGTRVQPFAALGGPPQDSKHKGGRTTLTIGANCDIREYATMHAGSDTGRGATTVGDNGFFLAYSHVAHDCIVGAGVTLTHSSTLGGHCEVGDYAIVGGHTAIHQFVRIGRRAFIGGCSAVVGDVIPYGMAVGNRAKLRGLNIVGMRRSGMSRADIHAMRAAYRLIFDPSRNVAENIELARAQFGESPLVAEVIRFMTERSKRRFTTPPLGGGQDDGDESGD